MSTSCSENDENVSPTSVDLTMASSELIAAMSKEQLITLIEHSKGSLLRKQLEAGALDPARALQPLGREAQLTINGQILSAEEEARIIPGCSPAARDQQTAPAAISTKKVIKRVDKRDNRSVSQVVKQSSASLLQPNEDRDQSRFNAAKTQFSEMLNNSLNHCAHRIFSFMVRTGAWGNSLVEGLEVLHE
eukprot:Nk52_evm1s465 gene=Nk52_evmTU1s465